MPELARTASFSAEKSKGFAPEVGVPPFWGPPRSMGGCGYLARTGKKQVCASYLMVYIPKNIGDACLTVDTLFGFMIHGLRPFQGFLSGTRFQEALWDLARGQVCALFREKFAKDRGFLHVWEFHL